MTLQLEKRSTIFQKNTHQTTQRVTLFKGLNPAPKKQPAPFFMDWNNFLLGPVGETRFFFRLGKKSLGPIAKKKHHRGSSSKSCATRVIVTRRPRKRCDVWWMAKGRWCSDLGHVCVLGVGDWVVGWWLVTVIEGGWSPPETNWEFTKWKSLNICGWKATFFWGCLGLFLGATCLFWGMQFQRLRKGFYFKTFINPQFFKQWVGIIGSSKGHHSEFHFKKGS